MSLHVEGLTVSYRGANRAAVTGVTFDVARGRSLAIVGESGSGKSTLAFAVVGLLPSGARVTADRLEYDGRDLLRIPARERRGLLREQFGFVFQSPLHSWNPTRALDVQIKDSLAAAGRSDRWSAFVDLLARVGIDGAAQRLRELPHRLSGGMLQRVAIALAVVHRPALLLADEPTSALDSTVQAEILRILAELRKEFDLGLVVITHDFGVVQSVADEVVVMYGGRVVERAPVAELLASPQHPYTKGLLSSIPRLDGEPRTVLPSMPPGELPGLGCVFAPRCPIVRDECRLADPELIAIGPRQLACPPMAGTLERCSA